LAPLSPFTTGRRTVRTVTNLSLLDPSVENMLKMMRKKVMKNQTLLWSLQMMKIVQYFECFFI